MELITGFIDIVLHLDRYLQWLVANYGAWIYLILFLDHLLRDRARRHAVPARAIRCSSSRARSPPAAAWTSTRSSRCSRVASFSGDNTNYWIGRYAGPRIFRRKGSLLLQPGAPRAHPAGSTRSTAARPCSSRASCRSCAPSRRSSRAWGAWSTRASSFYSFAGAILWIGSLTYAGYFFGNLPIVRDNLSLVIIGIVVLSIMPGVIEFSAAGRGDAGPRLKLYLRLGAVA